MAMKISEAGGIVSLQQVHRRGMDVIVLDPDEQRELLEALARVQGFSLVDREERKSLLALCEEVDEDDNDYDLATAAWAAWQDRAEALASAVTGALGTED